MNIVTLPNKEITLNIAMLHISTCDVYHIRMRVSREKTFAVGFENNHSWENIHNSL